MTANGYRVSFKEDENVLKLDCNDDCTTLLTMIKNLELYTLNGLKCMIYELQLNNDILKI